MGKYVKLHQLAWFYMTGSWAGQIDHINGVKDDNRWSNLREVDTSTNCLNQQKARKNNTLGMQGVHQIKKTGKYRATCTVKRKKHHLGVFSTAAEAHSAYLQFKQQYLP